MASTFDRLAVELVELLTPVFTSLESRESLRRLFRRLGHDPTAANLAAVADSLASTEATLTSLTRLIGDKADAGEELGEQDYLTIAAGAAQVLGSLRDIPAAMSGVDLGPRFFSELFDLLVVDYLYFRAQPLFRLLVLLGVIERESLVPGRDPDARAVPFERHSIHWNRLQRFSSSPGEVMEEVYGWGTAGFDAERLLVNLAATFDAFNVVSLPKDLPPQIVSRFVEVPAGEPNPIGFELPLYQDLNEEVNAEAGLLALPIKGRTAPTAADRGIAVMPYVEGGVQGQEPVGDGGWTFQLEVGAELAGGIVFSLRPSGLDVDAGVLDDTAGAGSVRMELQKAKPAGDTPVLLFGAPDSTRLEAQGFAAGVGGDDGDFYVAAAVRGLRLVLDVSDDALLSELVPGPMVADAGDVVAGWRLGRGIYFEQGSGLRLRVPLRISIFGVVRLHELGLQLDLEPHAGVTTLLSADASIGPLSLAFEDLGLELRVVPDQDGTFGGFDLDARLRSPAGYAVELDLGQLSGGGELLLSDHEYRGTLALEFESFGLSAFAILTTQLPGGRRGFSFVASIFGEFESIPLGAGFFLTGLGGIVGINRTADSDALRQAMEQGHLDRLLFPEDPIAEAPRILDELASVFPAREGQHVFGPVARIVFGRPPLVEGKLGLLLEVGERPRLLLLGLLSSELPSKDAALVSLRAGFAGEIDLAAGTVSLDGALLTGSRVLTYAVGGEMAVRTGWAPRIDHVISFGGLHPAYPRPANLRELDRLSINFGSNNPRVTISAYLAVTTNSLQFGGEATLYAKGPDILFVGQLAAEGELYLHALVYFDPFAFDANLGGSLSLLVDGDVVMGLGFDLRLTGPNPFQVNGRVWATVFGKDVGFDVEHTWGDRRAVDPPTVDPVAVLREGLTGGAGLEPIPSGDRVSGVVFAPAGVGPGAPDGAADPTAGVRYLQRAVPLGVGIEKLGEAVLAGGTHRYDLAVLDGDGNDLALAPAHADFVRGHFWALTEPERLRAPAFERHRAGFALGGDRLEVDPAAAVDAVYGYEVIPLTARAGPQLPPPVITDVELADAVFARWSGVHRREVAQPLTPEAVAGVGEAALSLRTQIYVAPTGEPAGGGSLSELLELDPDRGRTAPANPAVAAYVAAATA